jgi:FkbM family methyltransferase
MRELAISGLSTRLFLETHRGQDRFISEAIERDGIWEPMETEIILRALQPNDVFFDIGANIGYYSVIASTAVGPKGKVIAFEPDPANFELLIQNIHLNNLTNVFAYRQAVCESPGSRPLYLCEDNKGDHRLYESRDRRENVIVECIDLDSFIASTGLLANLVKLDTQGSEASILKGMQATLSKQAEGIKLILEFWPFGLKENNSSPEELLSLLPEARFQLEVIDEDGGTLRQITADALLEECHGQRYTEWGGFLNLFLTPRI